MGWAIADLLAAVDLAVLLAVDIWVSIEIFNVFAISKGLIIFLELSDIMQLILDPATRSEVEV